MEDPFLSPGGDDEDPKLLAQGMRYASLVMEFVGTILILGYVGHRLDEKYGWNSWGLLSGLLIGMGLGLWLMIKQLDRLNKQNK